MKGKMTILKSNPIGKFLLVIQDSISWLSGCSMPVKMYRHGVLASLVVSFFINAVNAFYDKEDLIGETDEWSDNIVIKEGQKVYHGYRVHMGRTLDLSNYDDLPGGAFVTKKVKPFYLNDAKLNSFSYKAEVFNWRDRVIEERKEIAKRIEQVFWLLKDRNIDIRIDKGPYSSFRIDSIFRFMNAFLTSENYRKIHSGNYEDFKSVRDSLDHKQCMSMAKSNLMGTENAAKRFGQEYDYMVSDEGRSSRSNYFINKYKDAIAIISSKRGAGTAFIMNHKWDLYLYTNAHVMELLGPSEVRILDGTVFSIGYNTTLHVAQDRDVVRVKLKDAKLCLKKASAPEVKAGEDVYVYGNSMGRDVVTVSEGKVIGIGSKMLEVDAPFVSGNSGSPVLNRYGQVIGIATAGANDGGGWETQGNRYSKNRYFVTSVQSIPWGEMTLREFLSRR